MNDYKVRFKDLRVTSRALRQQLLFAIDEILEKGPILMGPKVIEFESRIARYCDRYYSVGVSSGTDALYLALRACDIGKGDEVITTPMSWVATLNAIVMTGASPVFVDVGNDLNLNPTLLEGAITERTKAILPVHFTGRLCDMSEIAKIARKHGLLVVEDAAQAIGAETQRYRAGSMGDVAALSLNPMKVFPGYGEAGAVVMDDPEIEDRLRNLRYLGTRRNEVCTEVALNHKMDEIQAAMLLTGFDQIYDIVSARIEMARQYSCRLSGTVVCPAVAASYDRSSNFYDYVIMLDDRDHVREYLHTRKVETKIKHPVLLCDHPGYKSDPRPDIPVADSLVKRMVSLPLHDKMTTSDVDFVCNAIEECRNG